MNCNSSSRPEERKPNERNSEPTESFCAEVWLGGSLAIELAHHCFVGNGSPFGTSPPAGGAVRALAGSSGKTRSPPDMGLPHGSRLVAQAEGTPDRLCPGVHEIV